MNTLRFCALVCTALLTLPLTAMEQSVLATVSRNDEEKSSIRFSLGEETEIWCDDNNRRIEIVARPMETDDDDAFARNIFERSVHPTLFLPGARFQTGAGSVLWYTIASHRGDDGREELNILRPEVRGSKDEYRLTLKHSEEDKTTIVCSIEDQT